MTFRWQHVLGFIACLATTVCVAAQDQASSATLTLDQPLHFQKRDGGDILLAPGLYHLEAAQEHQLRLQPEAAADWITVETVELPHDRDLMGPVAGTLATDEDSVHVVLFLPGGTALDAVGTRSGVRTRAGTLTSAQLSQVQVSPSTLKTLSETVRPMGSPPPPILSVPPDGFSITPPMNITFNWRDGDGSPRASSFRLCLAEVGKACGQTGTYVYPSADYLQPLTSTMKELQISQPDLMLGGFQGKRLTWTVAACAPNTKLPAVRGVAPESCTYAPQRALNWPLPAPILMQPQNGAKYAHRRPAFRWEYVKGPLGTLNLTGIDYWLVCVSKPGIACPSQPVNNPNTVVMRVPVQIYTVAAGPDQRWPATKDQEFTPSTDLNLLGQGSLHWTVAACNTAYGCRYQQDVRQIEFGPVQ